MKTRMPKGFKNLASKLAMIAEDVKDIDTMEESLPDEVRFVPSIIPGFNRAMVLGGAPLGCIYVLHGPYRGGKSTLAAALVRSFQEQGHIALYIDAEHTTNKKWFRRLGVNPELLLFQRPATMEEAVDKVDSIIDSFDTRIANEDIPEDSALIIVIDSINKLTPANEMKRFEKEGSKAMEKGLARFRGLLLQAWLDRMTPIVGARNVAFICIAQEREVQVQNPWEQDFKVKGCQGLLFDSTAQIRVFLGKKLWKASGNKKIMIGQEHRAIVFKNKVGYPLEEFKFYTSNGKSDVPIGLNLPLSSYIEAIRRGGIIAKKGNWSYFSDIKGNGEDQFVQALRENPHIHSLLDAALNEDLLEGRTNSNETEVLVEEETRSDVDSENDEDSE